MKKKSLVLSMLLLSIIAAVSFSVFINAKESEKKATIEANTKHFKDTVSQDVMIKLEKSWDKGKKTIEDVKKEKMDNWQVIAEPDVNSEFILTLPLEEQASFVESLFSESRRNNLQKGDLMPSVLISPDKDRAIVVWERESGKIVYFEINSITQSNGIKSWSAGNANEI